MEVIDLDDSDSDDKEESDDSTDSSDENDSDDDSEVEVEEANGDEEIVILSENEYSQHSDDSAETSGSDAGEIDSSNDSDVQEIQEIDFPEPGIILESMPLPEPISEEPTTSTGSKLPLDVFNIDDFDSFVDPDDESETSKRKESPIKDSSNVLGQPDHSDILPFCDDSSRHSFSEVAEEELIALSSFEDESKDVADVRHVIHEKEGSHVQEQQKINGFSCNSIDFRIVGPITFISTESLKVLCYYDQLYKPTSILVLQVVYPSVDLETAIEKANRRGWKFSDCFQFSGWDLQFIRLELAEMILPKGTKLAEMICQLLVKVLHFVINC